MITYQPGDRVYYYPSRGGERIPAVVVYHKPKTGYVAVRYADGSLHTVGACSLVHVNPARRLAARTVTQDALHDIR